MTLEMSLKKRRWIKGQATRYEGILTTNEEEDIEVAAIELYLSKLAKHSSDLEDIHQVISNLCTDKEMDEHDAEFNEVIERLEAATIAFKSMLNRRTKSNPVRQTADIKLPKMELPVFGGSHTEWLSFHDLFTATVHNNATLSSGQKFQYLKSSLRDEALLLIHSIPVTDDNYPEAWDILTKRYNNTREIIDAHIQRLFDQPSVTSESSSGLRRIIDTTAECVRSLKVLKEPVQYWDAILLHIVKEKLDQESRRHWELSLNGVERPKYEELVTFIDQRARALSVAEASTSSIKARSTSITPVRKVHHVDTHREKCYICGEQHLVFKCTTFLAASIKERWNMVHKHSVCFNCLKADHRSSNCKAGRCRKCPAKHNTLLHDDNQQSKIDKDLVSKPETRKAMTSTTTTTVGVLLATAVVQVMDYDGNLHLIRALLDSGSEASFITERCAQGLRLPRKQVNITVSGIGLSGAGSSHSSMTLSINTRFGNPVQLKVEVFVLRRVTGRLPSNNIHYKNWSYLNNLKLADPTFYKTGDIDILLGADVFVEIIQDGQFKGPRGQPSAFNTVFGWAVAGPIGKEEKGSEISVNQCQILEQIQKLWELEEFPRRKLMTTDEAQCEEHFKNTHSRDEYGRYIVRLPFRNTTELGDSRNIAMRRFLQTEHRLQSNPQLYNQYRQFMQEYLTLGHMELIQSAADKTKAKYYLPHHGVLKEASTTTKLRVVFDASAKTSNGRSLNDALLVGPRLQEDLVNLLIRFRLPCIAITADLAKMYRQIRIHPDDADYQRIFWRESKEIPIEEYQLLTVTYGTASAPYQATKVLEQLATDEAKRFPLAAKVLVEDFYMDDLMSGAESIKEALELQAQLLDMCKSGGFELRKWASNSQALLETLPVELKEIQGPLAIESDETIKTLGLYWHPALDQFRFIVSFPPERVVVTKRTILSDVARIFDPLGLLAPVTIRNKMLIQDMWREKKGWDEELSLELIQKRHAFKEELPEIETIKVPRYISQSDRQQVSLHGFSDASEKAFAAAVYLRTINADGKVKVRLVAAKTRVAPLKTITIPRLELCGAVLLAKLLILVIESLKLEIKEIHGWTDSKVVLAWLMSQPQRWTTFVANRVSEIQQLIPTAKWHHVPGEFNPADSASRGILVRELKEYELWWQGPEWLLNLEVDTHSLTTEPIECKIEEKPVKVVVNHLKLDNSILMKFSSMPTLKHVTAYILRFITNTRSPRESRRIGPLSSEELEIAFHHWIRVTQYEHFEADIMLLKANKPLPSKSKLLSLNPYIASNGLLRVGGRLRHATLPIDQKHPIILPRRSKLTDLLINDEHMRSLHGGAQLLMTTLQRRFWIFGIRDAIRYHLRRCMRCVRLQAKTSAQMMGDLPATRVNPARALLKCGVDYAGPFLLRVLKGRGQKMYKSYVAVFACFTTRAIHLELVSDLTSQAFLAALKRFSARRGKSKEIFSDCGTNFVGADREMKEFMKSIIKTTSEEPVMRWMADEGITWRFNPPAAPHFGGLWEAGVKSVKYHLRRVVGSTNLNYEEMQTLLCQIEACLNSRPLTSLSTNPDDLAALTPGHFLIGGPLTAIPEPDLTSIKTNRLSRWQIGQQVLQHFWKRWRNEYLARLQQRPKWTTVRENLEIGDLVVLKDNDLPPTKWKLGRILKLHPGPDGNVRVVTLKTSEKDEVKRPIVKLCKLPLD